MSKKKKITLTLAAIIVAIGGGAQIYTNQQVDRVLQKFPYSLDNQLSLNVTETGNNFFSRDLIFSLENGDGKHTDVISTKLTALPFFITAESKLSDQLVRQLNKNLNITIDKNTINSKFSPVGDYLQSDVLTEFRDFTNKPQNLSVTLNFNAENKNVNIKTNLSGFNYDKNSKLEQINGQLKFVPVGDNQYDISSLELNAKNAELDLMNGENTKIQLKNAKYQFDVKKDEEAQQRDLTTKFNSDALRIANKERTTEENQTTINGLSLNIEQKGVQSAVNFADEFRKQLGDAQSIKNAVSFLVAVLTQNQAFNGSLSVKSVEAPKNQKPYFNLNDTTFSLKLANEDLTKADIDLQLNVGGMKQTPEDQSKQWQAKGAKIVYHLEDYNLENELAFIPFYLDSFAVKNPPKENNKALLTLKDKWAKESSGNGYSEITLQSFNYGDTALESLAVKSETKDENGQYIGNSTFALKKLSLPEAQLQLEDFKIDMPLVLKDYAKFAESQFCSSMYGILCYAYFTEDTLRNALENQWKNLNLTTKNTSLEVNLNTYPATKAYPVKLSVQGAIAPQKDSLTQLDVFTKNTKGTFSLALDKHLIDDTNEASLKIKNESPFWQYLRMSIKPEGKLSPIFAEDKDNYAVKLEKTDKGTFINGKTEEEIQQEILNRTEESETQEEISEEAQPPQQVDPQSETQKQDAVEPNTTEKTTK
ncbi:hypothetical protein [Aggregatibacter kilianii]|uniref:hypothetical protein n=1 Tax=Aggregatibacter kilianii TaxID=2025884 RepID=UPI000D644EEA|nr:hypothetical protein [Aggregatibacter kilianii]